MDTGVPSRTRWWLCCALFPLGSPLSKAHLGSPPRSLRGSRARWALPLQGPPCHPAPHGGLQPPSPATCQGLGLARVLTQCRRGLADTPAWAETTPDSFLQEERRPRGPRSSHWDARSLASLSQMGGLAGAWGGCWSEPLLGCLQLPETPVLPRPAPGSVLGTPCRSRQAAQVPAGQAAAPTVRHTPVWKVRLAPAVNKNPAL